MKYIAVYPAYLLKLGPSKDVSRPKMWRQPSWDGKLFPRKSGIESGLCELSNVPQLPDMNEVARDFLPLKQKPVPLSKWKKGVRQLLLWVGYSRPSRKSAYYSHVWFGMQRDRRW